MYVARDESLHILYDKCSDFFNREFIKFTNKHDSYRNIDKKFKIEFIDEIFVPLIRKYPPSETSLGLRVQQLVHADLSHCASVVAHENVDNSDYIKALISASSDYVLALEKFHEEFLQ